MLKESNSLKMLKLNNNKLTDNEIEFMCKQFVNSNIESIDLS